MNCADFDFVCYFLGAQRWQIGRGTSTHCTKKIVRTLNSAETLAKPPHKYHRKISADDEGEGKSDRANPLSHILQSAQKAQEAAINERHTCRSTPREVHQT
jgi:hypothetical protein